jgi:nicotinamidase-related amidase
MDDDNKSEGGKTDITDGTEHAATSDGEGSVHSSHQSKPTTPDGSPRGKKDDDHHGKKKHKKDKHKKHKSKDMARERKRVSLFICDPQNDYSDDGMIPIPNMNADSNRIYDLVHDNMDDIAEIFVSLDSRHRTHISNSISWVNKKGKNPEPFTIITAAEVNKGKWKARQKVLQNDYVEYINKLEKSERPPFIIWPDHCLIGTWGHAVIDSVNEALQEWAGHTRTTVEYILKGDSIYTEMYSALSAEVPNPNDPSTELDLRMIERLKQADRVLVCGQSLSHTVQMTMKDIANNWEKDDIGKLFLLTDCSSPVPGFESMAETFVKEMRDKGVKCVGAGEAFDFAAEDAAAAGNEEDGLELDTAANVLSKSHKLAGKAKDHVKHQHEAEAAAAAAAASGESKVGDGAANKPAAELMAPSDTAAPA